jgi:hypothetical protein
MRRNQVGKGLALRWTQHDRMPEWAAAAGWALAFKAGRALRVKAGWALALALAFKAGAAAARRLKSGLEKCIPHCGLPGRRRQIESLYALIQSLNEAVRVKAQ